VGETSVRKSVTMKRVFKTITSIICALLLAASLPMTALAADKWPECQGVAAEGAILVDARSGAVLFGKNIHEHYFPASITKILTALLVIENCPDLDEELTFSHRAVYDVEAGSSNAGYTEGDKVTVRDALYALMLASANEAANALAEHVGGSIEAFCDMMNEKAASLGCTDSHFANPSGLNNEQHYTSAADYAKICRAAFENDTFVQIDGTTYYDLPPMIRQPEGLRVYAHHSMLKKSNDLYYDGIIGGKTGYTSLAGNTLVTCAERDGLKLITVVLNGHKTHYDDTKILLDYGFENFKSISPSDYRTKYDTVFDDMDITGTGVLNADVISTARDSCITLPRTAEFEDAKTVLSYKLSDMAPEDACAEICYRYANKDVGTQYVLCKYVRGETAVKVGELVEGEEVIEEEVGPPSLRDRFLDSPWWVKALIGLGIVAIVTGIVFLITYLVNRNKHSYGFRSSGSSRRRH